MKINELSPPLSWSNHPLCLHLSKVREIHDKNNYPVLLARLGNWCLRFLRLRGHCGHFLRLVDLHFLNGISPYIIGLTDDRVIWPTRKPSTSVLAFNLPAGYTPTTRPASHVRGRTLSCASRPWGLLLSNNPRAIIGVLSFSVEIIFNYLWIRGLTRFIDQSSYYS